jgi:hypothetical protein
VFVERQVRDQSFEPAVLVLERSQPTQLAHAEMCVLLLPDVEGRFADAQLPADIGRGRTSHDLAKGVRDLLFPELDFFIGPILSSRTAEATTFSTLDCRRFRGRRHLGFVHQSEQAVAQ